MRRDKLPGTSNHRETSERQASDTASASVPDTLAERRVNPDTELTHAEADIRQKEHGCMASAKCNDSEAGAWQIA